MNEWMNECLMTPQNKKQIGNWFLEKGKGYIIKKKNEWMFSDTPAWKTDRLLGVRTR